MKPLSLVLALFASNAAFASEPWSDAAMVLAKDPTNAMHRLELAQQLSMDATHTEEAAAAMLGLVSDPTVGAGARAALADLVLSVEPRPGWDRVYQSLLSGERDAGLRDAIRIHRARAALMVPENRAPAIATLKSMHDQDKRDVKIAMALAQGQMLAGNAGAAEMALKHATGSRTAREALVLASFGSGHFGDRDFWMTKLREAGFTDSSIKARTGGGTMGRNSELVIMRTLFLEEAGDRGMGNTDQVAPDGSIDAIVRAAIADPTKALRGLALAKAGYGQLASSVLSKASEEREASYADLGTMVELGERLIELDQPQGAIKAFDMALKVSPGEPEAQAGMARAMIDLGRFGSAVDVVRNGAPDVQRRVNAEAEAMRAVSTSSQSDDAPALREAFETDPTNEAVARAWGMYLWEHGRAAEAMAPLSVAMRADTKDGEVLHAAIRSAIDSGRPADAVQLSHRIGDVAKGGRYDQLVGAMASAWVQRAEQLKRERKLNDAVEGYLVANMMQPRDAAILSGLAGTLWASGDEESAYNAYKKAFEADRRNPDTLSSLIQLAVATGRDDEARRLADRGIGIPGRKFDTTVKMSEAHAAFRAGRVDDAIIQYQRLLARDPTNGEVLRAMANARMARGEADQALMYFQRAMRADPDDQWSKLGVANANVRLGRLDEAEATLDTIQSGGAPALENEVRRARAGLLLERGLQAGKDGRTDEAYDRYMESLNLEQSTWTYSALAGLYFQCGDAVMARAAYDEALLLDPNNSAAVIGKIRVLMSHGQLDLAEDLANDLLDNGVDDATVRAELEVARSLYKADLERRAGEPTAANAMIADLYATNPNSDLARQAFLESMLNYGTAEERLGNARQILARDPLNVRALDEAMGAAHALGQTRSVMPIFDKAAEEGGGKYRDRLDTARLLMALDRAKIRMDEGDERESVRLVEQVEAMAGDNPNHWTYIGGAWIDVGYHERAISAFDTALRLDKNNKNAVIGKAGAYAAMNKANLGVLMLKDEYEEANDPNIGLALAELYINRGEHQRAEDILGALRATDATGGGCRVPQMSFPSGRVPEPFADSAATYRLPPQLEAKRSELTARTPGRFTPGVPVGAGFYARPGFEGEQFLNSFFFPIRVHELRAGSIAFDLEAVPTTLYNGVDTDTQSGISASAGISGGWQKLGFHARAGVSPLGFLGGAYATWFGSFDIKASDDIQLGVLTAREPVTDSLLSWGGQTDTASGLVFGRVSRTWGGAYFSAKPTDVDFVSLFGRGGLNQGLQMDDVTYWEIALDGGHKFTPENTLSAMVGGVVVAQGFSAQLDKFRIGQGGFFAPDVFAMGAVKAEGRAKTVDDRFHACAGGALGPQYIQAEDPDLDPDSYIQPGVFVGYALNASIDYRLAKYWRLGADYSRQVTGNTWQQNIAMVHIHFGPGNTWAMVDQPAFSPLSGSPIAQAQVCGIN